MGSDVAGNLSTKYNQTQGGINQSANDVINQVNQGYTKSNSDLISQVAANPTAAASNPDTLSQFQGQLNDTYTGPTSWADQGTQQGNVANAQQYANLSTTPGGLNVYAQELEGPQASQGVNQLDTMLLGGSPTAMGSIKAAADPYSTLTDYLNSQGTGITNAIGQGQSAAQNASQGALDAFTGANGAYTNLNNQIGNETAAATTAQQAGAQQQKDILAGINSGTLNPDQLKALGMTSDQYGALNAAEQRANTGQYMTAPNFGNMSATGTTDLGQYLNQNAGTAPQAGTVASPQEYAQMNAIQQLLGSKMPTGGAINPALASLAGTYNPSAATNTFDYAGALQGATDLGDQERAAAQAMSNQTSGAAQAQHDAGKSSLAGKVGKVAGTVFPVAGAANAAAALAGKKVTDQYKK
jgi:hypothetical protein